jgi:hypothetical protein
LLKIHIIPDMTLLLEVPMASTTFPTASAGLLLEVPMALATSIVLDPAARVVSSVEAATTSVQHLEEVPKASTALLMPIPMVAATYEVARLWEILHMASPSMREIPVTVLWLEFIT